MIVLTLPPQSGVVLSQDNGPRSNVYDFVWHIKLYGKILYINKTNKHSISNNHFGMEGVLSNINFRFVVKGIQWNSPSAHMKEICEHEGRHMHMQATSPFVTKFVGSRRSKNLIEHEYCLTGQMYLSPTPEIRYSDLQNCPNVFNLEVWRVTK